MDINKQEELAISACGVIDPRKVTAQEERYLQMRLRGLLPSAAARSAGLPHTSVDIKMMHDRNPHLDEILISYRESIREQAIHAGVQIEFTRNDATLLYLQAHAKSETAMEEIRAVDSLVKLHGLAAPEKKEIVTNVTNVTQIQQLSDEQLAALAGKVINLDPDQYIEVGHE